MSGDNNPRVATLVILQHFVGAELWRPVVERLACATVGVDLPGFGDGGPLPRPPTIPAMAAQLAESFGGERPHVVGNSFAGAVALELARLDAVAGVTAIAPVGFWNGAEAAAVVGAIGGVMTGLTAMGPLAGAGLGNPMLRTLALGALAARPRRVDPGLARAAVRWFPRASRPMLGPALAPFAREIVRYRVAPFDAHVPITFAWGDRDVVTPPHQARRAARLFPGARHVTLTGCGHVPMLDDADLVARTILI